MFRNLASSTLAVLMISSPAFAQRSAVVARPAETTRTETEKRDETKGKGVPKSANDNNLVRQQQAALTTVEAKAAELVQIAKKKGDASLLAEVEGYEGAVRKRKDNGMEGHLKSPVVSITQLHKLVVTDKMALDTALEKVANDNDVKRDALPDCR